MSASSCNSPRTLPYTPHFHPFPIASILPVPFHILHANCPTLVPASHFELPTDINPVKTSLMITSHPKCRRTAWWSATILFHTKHEISTPSTRVPKQTFQHLAPPFNSTTPKLVRTHGLYSYNASSH